MNSLAAETSPYLLQHKDNPVDWRVWSPQTLAEAKASDRPILLSIGYAACHWCHVMAGESFEDAATAARINTLFVPVKVDREEQPDIDAIYQNALSLMGQSGGWPLTMFLTPDGEPYWGGTYYPPVPKYGRPAFGEVLERAAEFYRARKPAVEKNTAALRAGLGRLSEPAADEVVTPETLDEIARGIGKLVDPVDGGFGRAPKFPQSPALALLWRGYKRTGDRALRDAVLLTLDRMAMGGVYDHLGGGFARYATDDAWLVPHFEKMLYDNAQLIELYTWAWQETGTPLYAQRVAETIGWLLREMRVEGAFAAALDADSEHEEGKFYVWAAAEVEAVLGEDAPLFKRHYDVHRFGNWEGKTILNRSAQPQLGDAAVEEVLRSCRERLLARRGERVRPGRDHKVLADWNGLAIAALVLAAEAFDRPEWLEAARQAFDFVAGRMSGADGRLAHSWCDGRVHPGVLDDYAAMSRAALALFQQTGEPRYLARAEQWTAELEARFLDRERGGFFLTSADATDRITRLRNALDTATPSGNGLMVEVLAALAFLTGRADYSDRADRLVGAFAGAALGNAVPLAGFLSGMDFFFNGVQIVLFDGEGAGALRRVVAKSSVPNRVFSLIAPGQALPDGHPAKGKTRQSGRATAYVCVGQTCSLPVTEPEALSTLLACGKTRSVMESLKP
jgi:uncharacterized protein YyaL (SSP411 family)